MVCFVAFSSPNREAISAINALDDEAYVTGPPGQEAVMRLDKLLEGCGASVADGTPIHVTGLTADSRAVEPGMLFAAMPGATVDGATFVPAALRAGAIAILCGETAVLPADMPAEVAVVRAAEPRLVLARMAAAFYPRQPATIVAVTGTNGKTSVAEFTRQIWQHLGHKAASLGTIGVVKDEGAVYGSLTTPDPVTLHKTLQELANEGITHLALEASSHGLDQYRLDGVRLAAGAFNNLGRDHLDYHPTIEAYFDAKMQLFRRLLRLGTPAIVCVNAFGDDGAAAPWDEAAVTAARSRGLRVLEVGGKRGAFIDLQRHDVDGFKQRLGVVHEGKTYRIELELIGRYQASNALVAAAFAIATGEEPARVFGAVSQLRTVNGRLDVVGRSNGGIAVVDYAHKPEALAAALDALRPFATGKLICIFGCGGNRDKGKRPIMGAIAANKADVVIVTDDNPRHEDAAIVRADIMAGTRGVAGAHIQEIGDRATAIRAGVAMLGAGDVLLVAGKGHETGQIIGSQMLPFSDHEQIETALRETHA